MVIDNEIQKYLPSAFNKNATVDMLCKLSDGSIVKVDMSIVSDQNEEIGIWDAGLKVYYVNTK